MEVTKFLCLGALPFVIACSVAPVLGNNAGDSDLLDGTYEGKYRSFPNSAKVEVKVENGRIVNIVLVRHAASWIGNRAKKLVVERIIKEQSTDVDVVTGATNTSHVIMNAVHQALIKAHHPKAP